MLLFDEVDQFHEFVLVTAGELFTQVVLPSVGLDQERRFNLV